MPTMIVESTLADPTAQRRVAKQLSFWWRAHGVDVNHVITRFVAVVDGTVYSGPFPLPAPFALVTCVVSEQRDADFRDRYAQAVRSALAPDIPPERVLLSFQPVDPALHYPPQETTR
jgi:hypothetical protein